MNEAEAARLREVEDALTKAVLWLEAAQRYDDWIVAASWPESPSSRETYYALAERELTRLRAVAGLPAREPTDA